MNERSPKRALGMMGVLALFSFAMAIVTVIKTKVTITETNESWLVWAVVGSAVLLVAVVIVMVVVARNNNWRIIETRPVFIQGNNAIAHRGPNPAANLPMVDVVGKKLQKELHREARAKRVIEEARRRKELDEIMTQADEAMSVMDDSDRKMRAKTEAILSSTSHANGR
jgi:hypothetical protein